MKIYLFDVDETLEIAGGPISMQSLWDLRWATRDRHAFVLGLNGNWAGVIQRCEQWQDIFSFVGPMEMTKEQFMIQIRKYAPADDYIMVGNIQGVSGISDDQGAAFRAAWRFIKESDFAEGAR